jgi:hypothetical protein
MARIDVLPRLDGRRAILVRVLYVVLAFLTAIVVAGGLIFNALDNFRNLPTDMRWGLQTFSSVDPGAPPYVGGVSADAARGGLQVNDVFVAIDGKPIPHGTSEYGIARHLSEVSKPTVAASVRHTDGKIAEIELTRLAHVWSLRETSSGLPLWVYSSGSFFSVEIIPVFLLGASLLLFLRRANDAEAMLFAIGFLLLCHVSQADFWLLALLHVPVTVMSLLVAAGQCIIIIAAAGFPEGRFDDAWSRTAVLSAVPLTVISAVIRSTETVPVNARLASAGILLLLSTLAMVGLARRYRRMHSGAARQQVKWVVFGFFVSAATTVASIRLIDVFTKGDIAYFIFFQLLQAVAFLALPLGLVVSLLRYRLYDAEATISRSAAYALLTLSLVIIFAGTEKTIELIGADMFGGEIGAVAGGIAAGLAAVLITPMHRRIEHWAKHRFQHELLRLRERMPELAGDLREVASLDQLARAMLQRINEGIHASRLALIVDGKVLALQNLEAPQAQSWLAAHPGATHRVARSDQFFPLRQPLMIDDETHTGTLLLGPRPDGTFYGADELETLDQISGQMARAIVICRQREASEAMLAQQLQSIASRIDRIEKTLSLKPA